MKDFIEQPNKSNLLRRLREKLTSGSPVLCAGATDAVTARNLEAGGCDLIFVTNGLRLGGTNDLVFGLLPYANANASVREMGKTIVAAVEHIPVIAGVCATDPAYGGTQFLRELHRIGFAGIQNDPSLGLFDGEYRAYLEAGGICYSQEVECIASTHELNLLAVANVFSTEEVRPMLQAGADIIVTHLDVFAEPGNTNKVISGLRELSKVCNAFREDVIILVRSDTSGDALQQVLDACPAVGGFQFTVRPPAARDAAATQRELKMYEQRRLGDSKVKRQIA
jgi:predicted TIM-barrel enzyme